MDLASMARDTDPEHSSDFEAYADNCDQYEALEQEKQARTNVIESSFGQPDEDPDTLSSLRDFLNLFNENSKTIERLWAENAELKQQFHQKAQEANLEALVKTAPELLSGPLKSTEWIVEGILPAGNVSGLSGPPGTGKSLLAQQLATFISLGRSFCGLEVTKGPALYLTVEDDLNQLHKRQRDINNAFHIYDNELSELHLASAKGRDMMLINVDHNNLLTRLPNFHALDEAIGKYGLSFVALDLLPDLWNGNEIVRVQVNAFIKHHLAYLAHKHQCSIL